MSEIYWMNVIGNLGEFSVAVVIVSCIALLIFCIAYCAMSSEGNTELEKPLKLIRLSVACLIISTLGTIFVPTKKDMIAIYGIGGIIDYVKSNDKAKELPDKCIEALTRYVDSIEKENKDNNN